MNKMIKRYCTQCGNKMKAIKYIGCYDKLSGKEIFRYKMFCPMIEKELENYNRRQYSHVETLGVSPFLTMDGYFMGHDVYTI